MTKLNQKQWFDRREWFTKIKVATMQKGVHVIPKLKNNGCTFAELVSAMGENIECKQENDKIILAKVQLVSN